MVERLPLVRLAVAALFLSGCAESPAHDADGGPLFSEAGASTACGCSADHGAAVDCNGTVVQLCSDDEVCDGTARACVNACSSAAASKQSVGCEYYATKLKIGTSDSNHTLDIFCYAAFVANTWRSPVKVNVELRGEQLPVESFARIPHGSGLALTYEEYDSAVGIPPGEMAVLFLGGLSRDSSPFCPVISAISYVTSQANSLSSDVIDNTGIGASFHIVTDRPVVAYQMNPYGGGVTAITGASLLLPTSVWGNRYLGISAYSRLNTSSASTVNFIAAEDDTTVTMTSTIAIRGGGGIPPGTAFEPFSFKLNRGEQGQITEPEDLTGSLIESDRPIGFMAGHNCAYIPAGISFCDHLEQMIPPLEALGNEYVGVTYRPRGGEPSIWRIVGAVDGTTLSYDIGDAPTSDGGLDASGADGGVLDESGPASLQAGEGVEFKTRKPFVVRSQDTNHPFLVFSYMSGSTWGLIDEDIRNTGMGDPDFVISVPTAQYLRSSVFFADPTYPETNVVVVRAKADDAFQDVTLDCAGPLQGWSNIGSYQWTRINLSTGNFVNNGACTLGRHEMKSDAPFGVWVWGWGSSHSSPNTRDVSYGYPGGMNVNPANDAVIVRPIPR